MNILKDALEEHLDVIRDYCDVEEYELRVQKEEELLHKLASVENETD